LAAKIVSLSQTCLTNTLQRLNYLLEYRRSCHNGLKLGVLRLTEIAALLVKRLAPRPAGALTRI
jgi:hypothetical protein